jgi:hypothetical protein
MYELRELATVVEEKGDNIGREWVRKAGAKGTYMQEWERK